MWVPLFYIGSSFIILETSLPEASWNIVYFSDCQLCSSLWLIIVLLLKFSWLDHVGNLTLNQVAPSLTALQSIHVALKFSHVEGCPRSTDIEFRLKMCILVLSFLAHWSELWMECDMHINLERNTQILDFVKLKIILFLMSYVYTVTSWLKIWQSQTNLLWACWNAYLWVGRLFGSTLKMLAKETTYFDVFYVQDAE